MATNGAVVWSTTYSAFGEATIDPGSTIINNLHAPGQYYDEETGLYYNNQRYYDPTVGRYITADPIGVVNGINMFAYVGNNPANQSDPLGLRALITCRRCIGTLHLSCAIFEELFFKGYFKANLWKNDPSVTPDDPYGLNGPLPPDIVYDVINANSDKFGRVVPSITNVGRAGEVVTPKGKIRKGLRFHKSSVPTGGVPLSQGCFNLGPGQEGADLEKKIFDLVNRHADHGGTKLIIKEVHCDDYCKTGGKNGR